MSKIILSIIIVHYKAEKELFTCLRSIKNLKTNVKYEIIIIDNDKKNIERKLKKIFPSITYIKSKENIGFGTGNNLGAKVAVGDYLFFLNPDTETKEGNLDNLLKNFNDKNVGIIAPLLLDVENNPFKLQGTRRLTPLAAIFSLSFMHKIWPKNRIANDFWLKDWDKKVKIEADTVPGTAFLVRRKLFQDIGGFDENFFLFFEENDICNRVRDLGYKVIIDPCFKVMHLWGISTKKEKKINEVFSKSRAYYFKKYYGKFSSLFINFFLELRVSFVAFLAIISLGAFLRFDRLGDLMMFIGDQAWFYLSAWDMLFSGIIPLVGITSSHAWLHQGPIWTYMLALMLLISDFHPVAGSVLSSFIGVVTIFLTYKIGSDFFSRKIGLLASLLYATSPLIIIHARMSYHTSPIPFFAGLFIYSLISTVKGKANWFPVSLLSLSLLYNFELATVVFAPVLLMVLFFGFVRKEKWFKKVLERKIISISLLAFLLPMIPVLIYDFRNDFAQTIKFGGWFIYKGLQATGLLERNISEPFLNVINFFIAKISIIIFAYSQSISILLLLVGLLIAAYKMLENKITSPLNIIFASTLIPLFGFFLAGVSSEAYLPMLFPGIILLMSFAIGTLSVKHKYAIAVIVVSISGFNAIYVYKNDYLIGKPQGYGPSLTRRIEATKKILEEAKGRKYNIEGKGKGANFETFIMNYEYLAWWLGKNPPTKEKQELVFVIEEQRDTVKVELRE